MENIEPAIALVRNAEEELTALIRTLLDEPLEKLNTDLIGDLSNIRHELFKQEMKLIDIRNINHFFGADND